MHSAGVALSLQILILSSVALLPHGDILTTNLDDVDDVACPGEELVYTCVSTGFSQWWTINNSALFQLTVKIFRREDTLASYPIIRGPYHFNFTLWSTDYLSFTSSLSTSATESLNGTQIVCASAGSTLTRHVAIAIGTPPAPFNLTSLVKQYYDRFYSIMLSWTAVAQFRVDYYLMTITSDAETLQTELILAQNTSNNLQAPSVVISNLPYNENITASLSMLNCIGSSLADNITFNIAGCPMFPNASDGMLLLNATSSQAPGTQLSFVCATEVLPRNFDIINITCEVNGQWQPSIEDKHCQKIVTVGTTYDIKMFNRVSTFGMYNNESDGHHAVPQHFKILLYCVFPTSVGLIIAIIIVTFAVCNRGKSGCNNKHERSEKSPHYETIDPEIHATNVCYAIARTDLAFNKHENSEEGPHYETISPEIHTTNRTCHGVVDINVAFNDAYISTEFNRFPTPLDGINKNHISHHQ